MNGRFFLTFDKVNFQIIQFDSNNEKAIAHSLKYIENQEFQKLKKRLEERYDISGSLQCVHNNYFIKENVSNIYFPTQFKPGEIVPEESLLITVYLIPIQSKEKIWDAQLYDLEIDKNFVMLINATSIQGIAKEIFPKYALIPFMGFPGYEGKLSTFNNSASG